MLVVTIIGLPVNKRLLTTSNTRSLPKLVFRSAPRSSKISSSGRISVFRYDEILEQWRIITKEKQVAIVVLDMPLLDTRQNRDLTGTLIADIVLQLLSYVAQTEREFIRQRQAEGIAAAKAQGVQFGRKPMARPASFILLKDQWKQDQISARAAAKQLGITHSTFLRWAKEDNG